MQDLEFRQLVERLKLRAPIEEIVAERVPELRKRGALFQARCPFHEERTPSFTVDPRRGTWHCWGACAEGGDVISFLERFDGLSFLDALRLLAQIAGEDLPESLFQKRGRPEDARRDEGLDVLRRAQDLFRRSLTTEDGAGARRYLVGRGLSDETLAAFGVGWAPRDGNPVLDAATRAGVRPELLVETGLVKRSEEGRRYDFFRGRLTIPIHDRLGRTVGFGARVLPEDEQRADGRPQAKYVNTPETPLFHKGQLVYGLHLAADAVRKSKHLVLVEGYTDVMAAHQAGHRNVAAVLGTSTTEDHAALIRRSGTQRVTLVFDGDEAGRGASERALNGLLALGIELRVATLPAGVDPCDLLLGDEGAAAFQALLDGAQDWFGWTLSSLAGLTGAALARRVDEVFALVARLEKPIERADRLAELARTIGVPDADVRLQWQEFVRRRRAGQQRAELRAAQALEPDATPREPDADPALERSFELLIGALLLDNSLIPVYADLLEQCPPGELEQLFRLVLRLYDDADDEEPIHGGRLLTLLGDDPARARAALLEDLAATAESPQVLARDQERWLDRRRHERELAELRTSLAGEGALDPDDGSRSHLLKNIHEELRRRRVPGAESSSISLP